MALFYTTKISDGDLVAYDLPAKPILPSESNKYGVAPWREEYTWFKLAFMIYGSVDHISLLFAANGITDPFVRLDSFRFLLPAFVNEVVAK